MGRWEIPWEELTKGQPADPAGQQLSKPSAGMRWRESALSKAWGPHPLAHAGQTCCFFSKPQSYRTLHNTQSCRMLYSTKCLSVSPVEYYTALSVSQSVLQNAIQHAVSVSQSCRMLHTLIVGQSVVQNITQHSVSVSQSCRMLPSMQCKSVSPAECYAACSVGGSVRS